MLELINISKNFGNQNTLKGVSLKIDESEFYSLLGPSGCGKTTLLRIIAGLESADGGQILLDGKDITKLSIQERPFHLIFQKYALFPHMSVAENMAFGLRMKKMPFAEQEARVTEMLRLIGLQELADRRPETLSGGQAQRVAVARALVNRPRVLLLDEPLSALDLKMREHMQTELKALQKKLGLTFIFVTHDQDEALALSDRVAVMNRGRIEQCDRPEKIYQSPQTQFVAEFVGKSNRLQGLVKKNEGSSMQIEVGATLWNLKAQEGLRAGDPVLLYFRPEAALVSSAPQAFSGTLLDQVFKGDHVEVRLNSGGQEVKLSRPTRLAESAGASVSWAVNSNQVLVFKDNL